MSSLPQTPDAERARVAGARVLIVHPDEPLRHSLRQLFADEGCHVQAVDGGATLDLVCQSFCPEAVLLDVDCCPDPRSLLAFFRQLRPVPGVVGLSRPGKLAPAVALMRAGAHDVLELPVDELQLLRAVHACRTAPVPDASEEQSPFPELIGSTPQMRELYELLEQVAPTDAPVLILGEHGTGKECVATALHRRSRRAQRPFVKVNVGAIPDELLESELFGHVKGAFTGAMADKPGLVEAADGGSLLLDEIGEMSSRLQAKLLRLLQQREFRRVGSSRLSSADFRVIASTNVDVRRAMRDGSLRQDLYFRISTVVLRVPPLRSRKGDLPALAEYFLRRFSDLHQRTIEGIRPDALDALMRHDWPGNVRELENVIQRSVILSKGRLLTPPDLPTLAATGSLTFEGGGLASSSHTLADLERAAIQRALERTGGNKVAAAALLGVRRPTLYNKLRKHGLPYRAPRQAAG